MSPTHQNGLDGAPRLRKPTRTKGLIILTPLDNIDFQMYGSLGLSYYLLLNTNRLGKMIKILTHLLALLIITSSTIASAKTVSTNKNWVTNCTDNVFKGTSDCALLSRETSLNSNRTLLFERNNSNEFTLVILSPETAPRGLSTPTDVTIKVDRNRAISTHGVITYRNDGYAQLVANFSEIPEILEQMKRGSYISTKFFIDMGRQELVDKFPLFGFTKSLKKAFSLDKRRAKAETLRSAKPKLSSNQSKDEKIIGQWLSTWGGNSKITIYKDGKQLLEKSEYSDGSKGSKKLFTKNVNGVPRYYYDIEDYKMAGFYTISTDGYLEFWGQSGNYYTAKPYTKEFTAQTQQDDLEAATKSFLKDAIGKELPDDMYGTFGDQRTLDGTNGQYWVAYLPKVDISFVSEKGSRKVLFVGRSRAGAINFAKKSN